LFKSLPAPKWRKLDGDPEMILKNNNTPLYNNKKFTLKKKFFKKFLNLKVIFLAAFLRGKEDPK